MSTECGLHKAAIRLAEAYEDDNGDLFDAIRDVINNVRGYEAGSLGAVTDVLELRQVHRRARERAAKLDSLVINRIHP